MSDWGKVPVDLNDLFQPLDIERLSRAISAEFLRLLDYAQDRIGREYRESLENGLPLPGRHGFSPIEVGQLYEKVTALLQSYDGARTETIRFLQRELRDHINRVPRRIIIQGPKVEEKHG